MTNFNGELTNYTYGSIAGVNDPWGNLTQVVQDVTQNDGKMHQNLTTTMTYDAWGRVQTKLDPNNQQSSFSYNAAGQPMTAQFPTSLQNVAGEMITYGYGANGRLESVDQSDRGTTMLSYETGSDRVSSVTDPVTGEMQYTYGLMGQRASMTLPDGKKWSYFYANPPTGYQNFFESTSNVYTVLPKDDPNSFMLALDHVIDDQTQGQQVNYQFDPTGRLLATYFSQTFDGNGRALQYYKTAYTFDDTGVGSDVPWHDTHDWLTQVTTTWVSTTGSGTALPKWENDYTTSNGAPAYDLNGNRLSNRITINNANTSRTEQYGYDELNRLTSVDYGDGESQTYQFDNEGNRLKKTDQNTNTNAHTREDSLFDGANRITSRTVTNLNNNQSQTYTYTPDNDGNTVSDDVRVNQWDSQNRLHHCDYTPTPNGSVTHSDFVYAADGIRHQTDIPPII